MSFTIPNLGDAVHDDQAFPNSTDIDIMAGGFTGNGIVSGCEVTAQGSPDMSVHVASGTAWFNEAGVSVASTDPDITAASSSPRRDLVVVDDAGDVSVVAGTPQAPDASDPSVVPVLPALPADTVALAAVDVPANASSITSSEIVDKRVASVGSFAAGLAQTKDESYFRQVGTSPLERWYPAGTSAITASVAFLGSDIHGPNYLHAVPFLSGRGGTIDRLAARLYTTTAPTAHFRLGIYEATSATNLYPSDLLLDSGDMVCTPTGVRAATVSQALAANTLYWFVHIHEATANYTIWAYLNSTYGVPLGILGTNSGLTDAAPWALYKSQTFGALPDPFPAGASVYANAAYLLAVRYSA